jgi:protein-S-isoprenylcysteine O-methyltransferase Ste14
VLRTEHTPVTAGPYRWVRHPFYVATALAVLTDSLMAANGFLALTGVVVLALIVLRTAREERNLVARFGDDYRRYMATTGRFFPRLGG